MKDLRPIRGHFLISRLVAEGEHQHQDFKFAISDARKIARSFSAFANASGGHLLVGVKDNGAVAGIRTDEDIYLLQQAATMYCDPPCRLDICAYRMEDGKIVVKAFVEASDTRPVWCVDTDGMRRAYFRVADENLVAHPLLVRSWCGSHHIVLTSVDSLVVSAVSSAPDGVDPDMVASLLHISRAAAEESVVAMTAMGLIRFEAIHGGRFRLLSADDRRFT